MARPAKGSVGATNLGLRERSGECILHLGGGFVCGKGEKRASGALVDGWQVLVAKMSTCIASSGVSRGENGWLL